jgi:hypothetical protein
MYKPGVQHYIFKKLCFIFACNSKNMKKITPFSVLICCCCWLFSACNTPTPEKYFDLAVLNCNMMTGFASDGLQRELDMPAVKIAESNKDKTLPVKRKDLIDSKIEFLEANMKRLKELRETMDSKDLLQASVALNEYVLPVYKADYQQLADLYDKGASKREIQSFTQAIHDKYYTGFDELFNKLATTGKSFAERHNIKVDWGR